MDEDTECTDKAMSLVQLNIEAVIIKVETAPVVYKKISINVLDKDDLRDLRVE